MKIKILILLAFASQLTSAQDTRIWATYYGGLGNDGGFSLATDNSGNVYMAGITMSNQGIAAGGFQNTFGGGVVDAYLVKFDSSGNRLWATYYGGPGEEMAFFGGKLGVATDGFGNVFLAGFTTSTTGIASGGFQNTLGGTAANAYLVKFDSQGNRIWATYYGGTSADKAYSVAADELGNVYIAGIANSAGLASGGFQNTSGGMSDAMLVKFDPNGNRLWATYYGGPGTEEGFSVTTDHSLNVYLAGFTTSTTGIASGGSQNFFGGGANDLFVVKFDSGGSRLWSTYYGGNGDELFLFDGDLDVATDFAGNIYLTGLTSSTTNIYSGGFQSSLGGGGSDAFLVKFDPAGVRQWATYYGGTDYDKGYSLATDSAGCVYLAGRTDSYNAIASGGFQNTNHGPHEAFLVKFNPEGTRACATFFGGTDVDECNAVAVDIYNNVYLGGNTTNLTGISWSGFQNAHGGGTSDGFLAKFTSCPSIVSIAEANSSMIAVYPNPANEKLFVRGVNISGGLMRIFDITGKEVYTIKDFTGEKEVDVSQMEKGIYCITLQDDQTFQSEKILIE